MTDRSNSTDGHLVGHVALNHGSLPRSQSSSKSRWPDGPLPLEQKRKVFSIAQDVGLLTIALLFLALAVGASTVSGRGIDDKAGGLIEQAIKLGPTVFSIIFAALVGRALKAIGRFRSEKGIEVSVGEEAIIVPPGTGTHGWPLIRCPIQTLWACLSTRTVFDAVVLQVSAGALSLPTILMGLLWTMSPVGGQASLRILYRTNQTSTSPATIRYMDTGPLGLLHTYVALVENYDMMSPNQTKMPFSMTGSFAAALMQDIETKSGPRDSWGNPKIPRIDMLNRSAADMNGWIDVSQDLSVESFTSLFGLSLLGVPDQGTVEFRIESAYVELNTVSVITNDTDTKSDLLPLQATCPRCIEDVFDLYDRGVFQGRLAQLLGPPWMQPNSTQLAQQSFTETGLIVFQQPSSKTDLSFEAKQVLVETLMLCEEGICKATKIRTSATDDRPQNITVFDFWGVFALNILNEANGENVWGPTMLEIFMNETSTIPVYHAGATKDSLQTANLARIKPEELSRRATLLLNSAVHLLYSYYGFAGDLPSAETTDYGPPHIPANGLHAAMAAHNVTGDISFSDASTLVSLNAAFAAASTKASVTRHKTIYKVDYAWVIVLVVSSMVLLIVGLVGLVMGLLIKGPDVFDPLMGLTYNNDFLRLPKPGSTLDANERAQKLGGMRIQLGEVSAGRDIHMIVVGRASEVGKLIKGKDYE